MTDFLLWIGCYNVIGSLVLMSMHVEKTADTLLRKFTEIISEPYVHGPFGRMWLWWAAISTLFLGIIMILSIRWNETAQREVVLLVLITYALMYFVLLFGGKKPKYGRGVLVTHLLWLIQIGWGLWVFMN